MTREEAIKFLRNKANRTHPCDTPAYEMAIRSLEAWDKVLNEADNGLEQARQLQARDYCSGADFVLDIINKHLQEVKE